MNIRNTLLILCFCLSLIDVTYADKKTDLKTVLQAKYNQSDAAFSRGNVDGYLSIYADNYIGLDDTGYIEISSKKQLRRQMSHEFRTRLRGAQKHSEVQRLIVHGSHATVIVQGDYVLNGQQPEGDRHQDMWQKVKKHWLLKQCQPLD